MSARLLNKRMRWLLLLALLLTPSISGHSTVQAAVSELRLQRLNFFYRFQQGRNYWNSASYLEAAAHFESLLSQYDQLPRPLQLQLDYYLGSSLHEIALYEAAEARLQSVLEKTFLPTLIVDAGVRLMDIYARRGDLKQLERIYDAVANRALSPELKNSLDFGAVKAYFRLGEGQYRRVRDFALKINPDSVEYPRAMLLSAIAMMELQEYATAEEDILRILKGQARLPEYGLEKLIPRLYLMLAHVQFDGGRHNESLQTLQQVSGDEYALDVLYARGWNLLLLGQYLRGMETFRDLAVKHPEDPRSLEATILGGYVLLNLAQFPESYAYFDTLETQYREAAKNIARFRKGLRSAETLELFLNEPTRLAKSPLPPQIADWVMQSRQVQRAKAAEKEVNELGRELDDFLREMKRMRVISAGFGSTFDNPATLERLLRNEMGLRLTEIRSRILENMLKPIRESLLATQAGEYNLINQAQSTRSNALAVIKETATPTKRRAVAIQRALRNIQHYLYMVASEELTGVPDPARKGIEEKIQLGRPAIDLIDRLLEEEERIAFLLLTVLEEEERLWGVISKTIEVERASAERILRRLGLWETQAYIDRLELLYRATSGIETILNENGKLLLQIQQSILNDVIAYTNQMVVDLEVLREHQAAIAAAAKQVRLNSIDESFAEVLHRFREAEARTAGGKLDVGWRIKEVENRLMLDVLAAEKTRTQQLDAYYKSVQDRAEAAAKQIAVLDEQLEAKISGSVAGNQTVKLGEAVEGISKELDKMNAYINELLRGSAAILERSGTVSWTPETSDR